VQRIVKDILIGIVILIFQLTVVDWIRIQNIRPDLLMLYILYLGYREGKVAGMLFGFAFGLLQDLTAASAFIGLSSLSKTMVGFSAGYLQGKFTVYNPFTLYGAAAVFILLGQFIYFYVYYAAAPASGTEILGRFVIPAAAYTVLLGGILMVILPLRLQE